MNEDINFKNVYYMKYVRFILSTLMWLSLLLSFIAGAFLVISGIKMVYSELILINALLTNGLIGIIIGGLILRFVILIIQGISSKNE
jgi:hypothetical protein